MNIPVTILDLEVDRYNHIKEENIMYTPKPNEELTNLVPVAVNYRCELCSEGYMEADPNEPAMMLMTNPPQMQLRTHICNKCHGKLQLPKTYPYIEWLTRTEYNRLSTEHMIEGESI